MSEVDKHAQENISRILVGNKKDLEDVPADRYTPKQQRARMIRTLNQEYGTTDLRYLGTREQQQRGVLFGGT